MAAPTRRRAVACTQTDASEFLSLREVQLASSKQQARIKALQLELQDSQAQAAAALDKHVTSTAAERADHHRALVRHLERNQAQALAHERAASAATLANQLVKQKEGLEREIRQGFEGRLYERGEQLTAARAELDELRVRVAKRDEELVTMQQQLARDQAALEVQREPVVELEAERL